ncbi:hypothetical protein [Candidatus Magnetominusculus dajiuhuensis]|uniref:hypothetical protein n=1 Tax=Candidatus Magnetominusculus dajiuhuensis TaxID=3137712 RepID=UPI003B4284E3
MNKIIPFFDILNEDDIQWFLNNGVECIVEHDTIFINNGYKDIPLYLIIDGFVELYIDSDNRLS